MDTHTSTSSQGSEDSLLPLGELDSRPSPSAKVIRGAGDSSKGLGASRSMKTSGRSTDDRTGELTFSPEDLHASRPVVPGTKEAQMMTVGSGVKLSVLWMKPGRMASFSRRLLASSTWTSTEFLLRWRGAATRSRRSIYRLAPSIVRRSVSDSGSSASWATPCAQQAGGTPEQFLDRKRKSGKMGVSLTDMALQLKGWPTPRAEDSESTGAHHGVPDTLTSALKTAQWPTPVVSRHGPESDETRKARGANTGTTLVDALSSWPTPQARDIKGLTQNVERMDALPNALAQWPTLNASDGGSGGPRIRTSRKKGKSGEKHSTQLADYIGTPQYGCLATMATFVERQINLSAWLMGYPAAYLKHWETRLSRRKPTKSSV